jgi:hypothetical protein
MLYLAEHGTAPEPHIPPRQILKRVATFAMLCMTTLVFWR